MFEIWIRRPLRALLCACLALAALQAHAQGGPPMLTDDPGTPGDGHWEINIATLSDHSGDTWTYALPLLDINYGTRHPDFPDVPTLTEAGYPGADVSIQFTIQAPAAVSKDIVATLSR